MSGDSALLPLFAVFASLACAVCSVLIVHTALALHLVSPGCLESLGSLASSPCLHCRLRLQCPRPLQCLTAEGLCTVQSAWSVYRDARADTAKSVDNVRNVCSALLVRTLECVACRQLLDPPPCLECLQCPGVDIAYIACSPLGCPEALHCRQCLECLQRLDCMRASEVFAGSAALHSVYDSCLDPPFLSLAPCQPALPVAIVEDSHKSISSSRR